MNVISKPMLVSTVVSGDAPLSPSRFQKLVCEELSFVRPGTLGFDADGAQVLVPGSATIIKLPFVSLYSQAQANASAAAARLAQP